MSGAAEERDPPGRKGGPEAGGEGSRSRAVEDYLKAVYKLQQVTPSVSTSALAQELDRSAASVTNMVQALGERSLLEYEPYRGVRLTPQGELAALRIIRRHRVLELYLIQKLGFSWDHVHAEAERLEHAASDHLIDQMAKALGEPSFDPHGSPIPTREGEMTAHEVICLSDLSPGTRAVVREVADESPESLRRLASLGLYPGTRLRCRSREGAGGDLRLEVEGEERRVEQQLARTVSVEIVSGERG